MADKYAVVQTCRPTTSGGFLVVFRLEGRKDVGSLHSPSALPEGKRLRVRAAGSGWAAA